MNTASHEDRRDDIDAIGSAYAQYYFEKKHDEDYRIVGIGEHLIRLFGFKSKEPLYGIEGDKLAKRYPERGYDWAACASQEEVPAFISISRRNQTIAYMMLCATIMSIPLSILYAIKHQKPEPKNAEILRFESHQLSAAPSTIPTVNVPAYSRSGEDISQSQAPTYANAAYSVSQTPSFAPSTYGTLSAARMKVVVNR